MDLVDAKTLLENLEKNRGGGYDGVGMYDDRRKPVQQGEFNVSYSYRQNQSETGLRGPA